MEKKYILVVDDDPEILNVMTETLKLNPYYEVISLKKGDEVIKYVESDAPFPDLFVLDIWLPDIDGDEIAIRLREHPATKDIPIILISAVIDAKTVADEVGADDYLSKPFQIEELEYKVGQFLGEVKI